MGMTGNVLMNDSVVVKFPIAAKRVNEEISFSRVKEVLIRVKIAEKNLTEELDRHIANRIQNNVNETLALRKVSSVDELPSFYKYTLECFRKRIEGFHQAVEDVLKSLVLVSPREVIYRKHHYVRYEEVKNLTLNHLEALEERMRDFEYDSALAQAHEMYASEVRAFLKFVTFV